jgi:predicted nucleic acid-binding protein
MTSGIFIDSNVWVYLFTADDDKKSGVARDFIAAIAANRLIVSYQVVNEVGCVLKKKGYSEPEIRRVTTYLTDACEVCGFSADIALSASELREKHAFSYWDGHIAAAALQCVPI